MRYALIVDDQPMVAGLIKSVLEQRDFVCEVAHDAAAARKTLEDFDPDIAILDLHLGEGPSGFDLAHFIEKHHEQVAILAMTQFTSPEFIDRGKTGLPKSAHLVSKSNISDTDLLFEAVEGAIDSDSAHRVRNSESPLVALTVVQAEVLRLMAEGYRTAQIAEYRKTTVSAVEQAITGIYKNLGIEENSEINQRTEAIRTYIANAGLPTRSAIG